jgi:hypothetical protein
MRHPVITTVIFYYFFFSFHPYPMTPLHPLTRPLSPTSNDFGGVDDEIPWGKGVATKKQDIGLVFVVNMRF